MFHDNVEYQVIDDELKENYLKCKLLEKEFQKLLSQTPQMLRPQEEIEISLYNYMISRFHPFITNFDIKIMVQKSFDIGHPQEIKHFLFMQ
jgi:hypothetical protein